MTPSVTFFNAHPIPMNIHSSKDPAHSHMLKGILAPAMTDVKLSPQHVDPQRKICNFNILFQPSYKIMFIAFIELDFRLF